MKINYRTKVTDTIICSVWKREHVYHDREVIYM